MASQFDGVPFYEAEASISNKNMEVQMSSRYYDYGSELFRRLVRSHDLGVPLQLELHPGHHCDLFRCPHCYGHGQLQMPGSIGMDNYLELLDSIKSSAPAALVELAGIRSDPTTFVDLPALITAIKVRGFAVGIHTKGYRLGPEIREALTADYSTADCFITISVDAGSPQTYAKVHRIPQSKQDSLGNSGNQYWSIVLDNIKNLHELRQAKNSNLRIKIAYLLFQENGDPHELDGALEVFDPITDEIRFSVPQERNDGGTPSFHQNSDELLRMVNKRFEGIEKVTVLDSPLTTRHKNFRFCWAQRFQVIVDKAGFVFPCPQTALRNFRHLSIGNIKYSPLSSIILGEKRRKLLIADIDSEMGCRICDRKDERINLGVHSLFAA